MVGSYRRHNYLGTKGATTKAKANPTGDIPLMQSPLIFIAEFQTVKSQLLKYFGLSDHGGFLEERSDDSAQGPEERLSILKP
jgi:hypothetical protein